MHSMVLMQKATGPGTAWRSKSEAAYDFLSSSDPPCLQHTSEGMEGVRNMNMPMDYPLRRILHHLAKGPKRASCKEIKLVPVRLLAENAWMQQMPPGPRDLWKQETLLLHTGTEPSV